MALLGTAGRWGAPSPAASPAKASGPTEGQVKGKYLAMTLMQVRGECTKLGNTPQSQRSSLASEESRLEATGNVLAHVSKAAEEGRFGWVGG